MPRKVTSTHPEYDRRLPLWVKTRDAIEGEERVKSKGERYLDRLEGHETTRAGVGGSSRSEQIFGRDPYVAYVRRAAWFGAPERTVKGLAGAIMRKDPEMEWPGPGGPEDEFLETVGSNRESWSEVVANTVEENVGISRYGILVDAAEGENEPPRTASYDAENIRDWDLAEVDGKLEPVLVTLREERVTFDGDGKKVVEEQFRVLKLGVPTDVASAQDATEFRFRMDLHGLKDEDLGGLIYFQEVWVEDKEEKRAQKTFRLDQVVVPRMFGGRLLDRIPFVFFNKKDTRPKPDKPALLDLVNLVYSIYRNSADLEHGRHFTALPTAVVTAPGSTSEFIIGSQVAWVLEKGGTAFFLEFTGAGLGHLQDGIVEKKKEAAAIGARMLEEPPRGVEAEGTVRLRQAGEHSVLSRLAGATSQGLTRVLQWLAEWMNHDPRRASIKLNQDFVAVGIDPKALEVLMAKLQAGTISYDTYFFNLQRGEVYPEGRTMEEELDLIARGGIPGMREPVADDDEPDDEPDPDDEPEEE